MKAITVADFGAQPQLSDMPKPTPGQGQLLVKLAAAGVNPYDWKVIDGIMKGHVQHDFPLIPGQDGAGTIEAVGECVSAHQVGDKIYGQFFTTPLGHGSYAEYIVVPQEGALDTVPQNIALEDAAALPTAAMTANALIACTGLEAGPTVFIVGATGGVGSFAVQIARSKGLHVIATASAANAAAVKKLGADDIIDHTQGDVATQLRDKYPQGIDALVDLVSNAGTFAALAAQVKPGGYALTTAFVADEKALEKQGIHGQNFELKANANALQIITQMVESGTLQLPALQKVPLSKAAEALSQSRSGKTKGKIVLVMEG